MEVIGFPLNSRGSAPKSARTSRMISFMRSRWRGAKTLVPVLGHENHVIVQDEDTMPAGADVRIRP
jgi:hypothetical protein